MINKHFQDHIDGLDFRLFKADMAILEYYFNTPEASIIDTYKKFAAKRKKPRSHFHKLLSGLMKNTPENAVVLAASALASRKEGVTRSTIRKLVRRCYGTFHDEYSNRVVTDIKYEDYRSLYNRIRTYTKQHYGVDALIYYDGTSLDNQGELADAMESMCSELEVSVSETIADMAEKHGVSINNESREAFEELLVTSLKQIPFRNRTQLRHVINDMRRNADIYAKNLASGRWEDSTE